MLLVLLAGPAHAQTDADRYTLVLRGVAADAALETLVQETGLSLLYDSGLVPTAPVYCAMREQPAETMLRCIVDATGLDFYRLRSGTYVLTRPVEQAPRTGTLAGSVVDADTGEPLPYATVLLADASTGTVTDADGYFSLAPLVAGPYRVLASYVGYEAVEDRVVVPPDGQARRRILLQRTTAQGAPVVVNGLQQRLPSALLGRGEVALRDPDTPGDLAPPDPLDRAAAVLGVTRSPSLSDLHIQGGEAGEHQILLDGVPVFYPVALGRMLGAFSPLALGRMTVQKAGFGAAHGSYTAGVIQAEHALAAPGGTDWGGALQSDPLSTSARLAAPLRLGGATGRAMVAARTSLWDLFRDPLLDRTLRDWNVVDPIFTRDLLDGGASPGHFDAHRHGSALRFLDLHAAAVLRTSSFTTVRASGYLGHSSVGTELFASGAGAAGPLRSGVAAEDPEEPLLMLTRDRYAWTNAGGRIKATRLLGARAVLDTRLRASTHRLHHAYAMGAGRFPDAPSVDAAEAALRAQLDARTADDDDNRVSEVAAETHLSYSLTPHHLVEGGLEVARLAHRFRLGGGNGLGLDSLRLADAQWRMAGYAAHRWTLGLRTVVEPSVRATYVADRQGVFLEPRLAVRHDLPDGPLGLTAVRVAGGLYRQFVGQYDLSNLGPSALAPAVRFWLPVGRDVAPPRTVQVAAEALLAPHPAWRMQVEGYYKWQPLVYALDYGALVAHSRPAPAAEAPTQAALLDAGRGIAYGAALRLTHTHARGATSVSYGYDLAQRRFPTRFGGRYVQAPWSEPHRITARADLRVWRTLQLHGRWRSVLGRAWGFRQAYYDFFETTPLGSFRFDTPTDDTVPALHELDLGVSLTHCFGQASQVRPALSLRLDVLNVLDRANVLDWSLQGSGGAYAPLTRYLPGRGIRAGLQLSL